MQPRGKRRRAIGTVLLVMFSLGAAVGVSGCAPEEGTISSPPPSPTAATSTPVLPSNEEALAIVEELVPRLLAAEGAFLSGASDLEALRPLATEALLAKLEQARADAESAGYIVSGAPTADTITIQSVQLDPNSDASVIAFYACLDRTNYSATNSEGSSVRGPAASNRFAIVGTAAGSGGTFQLEGYEAWSGSYSC